jgi:hypothetical protein
MTQEGPRLSRVHVWSGQYTLRANMKDMKKVGNVEKLNQR